ncbi:MAG TPA: hypothetical protein VEQ42_05170 [Pyrinomonadaceae bacterium]|nr:hypothetical protein [Pyrinomonadaceae bacterium]
MTKTCPGGVRALVGALLERVNLTSASRPKVGGFSGGMRQRPSPVLQD